MCQSCWTGHGKPVLDDVDVLATALLVERLYAMPGCSTGGPLHWMLDDMNLDDEQFGQRDPIGYWHGLFDYLDDGRFDKWASASPAEKAHIRHLSEAILAQLADMPEGWRAAVVAWAFGWIGADMPEYAARARTQERMDRVEEYAEELLDKARALPPIGERGHGEVPPKACVPVPCPAFTDGSVAADPTWEPGVYRRGLVDGVIHPGPGLRFAPDAEIRGPFERATVNPDGSATLHGLGLHMPPLVGNAPEGAPTFAWAHYTVTADGRTESAYWNAADLAAITAQPEIDLAEVLAPTLPKVTYRNEENAKE
jgi:hypothetical protein